MRNTKLMQESEQHSVMFEEVMQDIQHKTAELKVSTRRCMHPVSWITDCSLTTWDSDDLSSCTDSSLWLVLGEIWGIFRSRSGCHLMPFFLWQHHGAVSNVITWQCSTCPAGGAVFHETCKPKCSMHCVHKGHMVLLTSMRSFFWLRDFQIRATTLFLTVINIIWMLPKPTEKW